jgi:hypothetical protein
MQGFGSLALHEAGFVLASIARLRWLGAGAAWRQCNRDVDIFDRQQCDSSFLDAGSGKTGISFRGSKLIDDICSIPSRVTSSVQNASAP